MKKILIKLIYAICEFTSTPLEGRIELLKLVRDTQIYEYRRL